MNSLAGKVGFFILFLKAKNNWMSSKKRKYWNKLRNRYKLTIFNESTYEEVMHLRLSPLHVLTALSTLAVVLIILTIMLIAFTNLRELHPGLPEPTVETSDYTKRSTG